MPVNFNEQNSDQEDKGADNRLLHMQFRYKEEQEEDIKSIASESSFESLKTDYAYSNLTPEQINEMAAKIAAMTGFDKYKGKTNRAIKKYSSDFSRFFKVHCIDAAENYIANLPKEKYISLNCSLTDPKGQNPLDFSGINAILQAPSNNITVDSVINLAIKLNVGSIKATYTGERTQTAHYQDCGGSSGNWVFSCQQRPAWASYLVQVFYYLPTANLRVPLISFKFANQAATRCYQVHGGAIFDHADNARASAASINNMPLELFLKSYWGDSRLVENSIKTQPIPVHELSKVIESVALHALANRNAACQNFRRALLENKREFFTAKLDKIDARYNFILAYARLAGVTQENIAQIQNPLVRVRFDQDLINLSLVEHAPDGSESLFQKCKNMAEEFGEKINKLLYPEPDSEVSSDEDLNKRHRPRPPI